MVTLFGCQHVKQLINTIWDKLCESPAFNPPVANKSSVRNGEKYGTQPPRAQRSKLHEQTWSSLTHGNQKRGQLFRRKQFTTKFFKNSSWLWNRDKGEMCTFSTPRWQITNHGHAWRQIFVRFLQNELYERTSGMTLENNSHSSSAVSSLYANGVPIEFDILTCAWT